MKLHNQIRGLGPFSTVNNFFKMNQMHIICNNRVATFTREEALADQFSPLVDTPLHLPHGQYRFMYSYPLSHVATFMEMVEPTNSVIDILVLGRKHYEAIYETEKSADGETGNIPGMLNRASSHGPYGIWGHHIGDLYFERVTINVLQKTITFGIGS